MTRSLFLAAFLLCALLGCARLDLEPDELVPPVPATAASLAEGSWSGRPGRYRLQLALSLERGAFRMPMTGLLDLDRDAGRVRLAGLADTGFTLCDIEAGPKGTVLHSGIEPFRRFPDLTALTGRALRRIFLDPAPDGGDNLKLSGNLYRLARWRGEEWVEFLFSGDGRLLAKSGRGEETGWSARYRGHRDFDGLSFPSGIAYRDSGGSLMLRIETIRRIEDGT